MKLAHPRAAAVACTLAAFAAGQVPPEPPPSPVPQLLELLASDNASVRREGADGLGAAAEQWFGGKQLDSAVEPLLQLVLHDHDAGVVATALAALWRIDPVPTRITRALELELPALREAGADADVVAELGALLRKPGKAWAEGALLDPLLRLAEAGPARWPALATIAAFGADAGAAAPRLAKLLTDVQPAERWRVGFALAAAGEPDPLNAFLADDDPHLRLAASLAWQRSGRAKLPAAAVAPWVGDPRATIQLGAIAALPAAAEIPASAARAVAECVQDPRFMKSVLQCLEKLGSRAAAASESLLQQLREADANRVHAAIAALAALGPGAADAADDLAVLALHGDEGLVWQCGRALARIPPAKALPALLEAWREDWPREGDAQPRAVMVLRGMGSATAGELGFVMNLLTHGPRVRREALSVLAAMGPAALPALPHVLPLLDDPDRDCIVWACYAIQALGPPAARTALPQIERCLAAATDDYVRTHLRLAATRMGPPAEPLLLAVFDQATFDPLDDTAKALVTSPEMSAKAAARIREQIAAEGKPPAPWRRFERPLRDAFAQDTPLPPTLVRELQALAAHPDFQARFLGVAARIRELVPPLCAYHPLPELVAATPREPMLAALPETAKLAQWLRGLVRSDNGELAGQALRALPRFPEAEDSASVALAIEVLAAADGRRGAAVEALAEFGPRASAALPHLIAQLDTSEPFGWSTIRIVAAIRAVRGKR
ncbi:MAG TPA: hypothetical protein VF384_03225 [Planctomycetota bacterium]